MSVDPRQDDRCTRCGWARSSLCASQDPPHASICRGCLDEESAICKPRVWYINLEARTLTELGQSRINRQIEEAIGL